MCWLDWGFSYGVIGSSLALTAELEPVEAFHLGLSILRLTKP